MTSSVKRFIIFATLAIFIGSTIATIVPVAAVSNLCSLPDPDDKNNCLDDFYGGNDILYYDPNATVNTCATSSTGTGSTSGPLIGNDNAEKIFKYLVAKGLSAEQAAGILGNFQAESGFDPAIIQGGAIAGKDYTPVNGVGFGIAQWTYTERQGPLVAMAKSSGRSVTDLSLQLDFLWQELNSTHNNALVSLKQVTSPERAAFVFHRDFEGSASSEETVKVVRGGAARQLYEKYKTMAPQATTTVTGTCQKPASGDAINNMSDKFTIYNQCQYPPYGGSWGTTATIEGRTVCNDGCIPTSLAMISKNLTGREVTPADTASYYSSHNLWASGGGSNNTSPMFAADAFGVTQQTMGLEARGDVNAYKDVFAKGGLIMAISTGPSPFMASRHAIVLRGITTDNKFLIADPGQGVSTNTPPFNQPGVDQILTSIRSDSMSHVYIFYKKN